MAIPGRARTFRAKGLSDAVDGTNAFPGAMLVLQNLIPAPGTRSIFIPRPAATQITDFTGFTSPAAVNALLQVGTIAYGVIAETSGTYNGKDVPFCYDTAAGTFRTISIPGGAASLPASPAASGDWTPPTMAVVGSRIVLTHPGFTGGANPFFGWLDISSFSDNTKTGDSHSNTTIDNLSGNVLTAGWQVGMVIVSSGGEIPANTTITAIAVGGLSVTISQAATGTLVGSTFTVTGGTAAAPQWGSGNTNGNALTAVPVAVSNFNGRAYFAVGAGVQFSDSGFPCRITNATQALTFANGLNVTALAGLPLNSISLGGIVQALIAFQSDSNMVQITGDPTTNNLSSNNLGVGVGTLSPLTICQTPAGLAFVSPHGLVIVDFMARVSDPIGYSGEGVWNPFRAAVNPTRMCAAYNSNVLRISVQNGAAAGQPVQEYWYDMSLKIWSGPHSFPAALIQPLQTAGDAFIMAASGVNAKLWSSDVVPDLASVYVENGAQMTWIWQTSLQPDSGEVCENAIVESTIGLILPSTGLLTVEAVDESGLTLDTLSLAGSGVAPTVWGAFIWGASPWGNLSGYFRQYDMPWTAPLVFKQMSLRLTGNSVSGLGIGNFYARYQPLGYRLQAAGGRI